MTLEYQTTEYDQNKSVKDILQKQFHISNRLMTKLKSNQKILVNNEIAWVNKIPSIGSWIRVIIDFEEEDNTIPQEGELEVLYEDEYFLAVNKPANLVVHPCSYHPDHTLANYVKAYLNNQRKIRPINRLDNGTSGIVLFAKNEYIQEQFKNLNSKPEKEYWVIVYGILEEKKGTIDLPIARKAESLIEREVNQEKGQKAITHYEVISEAVWENKRVSLIKVLLETGRTHQIRVHMSSIGHPLLGDTLYGKELEGENKQFDSQALHAKYLRFIHPITDQKVIISASLPQNMAEFLKDVFSLKNISE